MKIVEINKPIASRVILAGDPNRIIKLAHKYLTNLEPISSDYFVGYNGYYNNQLVTLLASGMGNGTMYHLATQLYQDHQVESIVRIGTCGALQAPLEINDLVLVAKTYTNSNLKLLHSNQAMELQASQELNKKIKTYARLNNIELFEGNAYSHDVFYQLDQDYRTIFANTYDCKVAEMESYGLFLAAYQAQKHAACLLVNCSSSSGNWDFNRNQINQELILMLALAA